MRTTEIRTTEKMRRRTLQDRPRVAGTESKHKWHRVWPSVRHSAHVAFTLPVAGATHDNHLALELFALGRKHIIISVAEVHDRYRIQQ